jgi:hypothetical protein
MKAADRVALSAVQGSSYGGVRQDMAVATSFREQALAAARAEVRAGESVFAVFPAATLEESTGGLAPGELWPLIIAVEHLIRRRRDHTDSRASLFPLSPRMIIALSDQRLLIWAARLNWRPGNFLGYVSRDRILQVTVPGTGSGWRRVLIHLANEPTVSINVPSATAGQLAAALSGTSAGAAPEANDPR